MARPDYIKCIEKTPQDKVNVLPGKTFCGLPLWSFDWRFQDAEHALASEASGSRLVACPECMKAVSDGY